MSEATEAVEPVLDAASDAILDGVDDVVETIEVVRNNPVVLVAAGVLGLAAGGIGGYFIAKKVFKDFYEDLSQTEIAEAKEFYANLNKVTLDGGKITPKSVMEERHGSEAAAEALRTYRGQKAAEKALEPDEDGYIEIEEGILVDAQDEEQMRKIEKARIKSVSVDKEPGPAGGRIESVEEVETRNVFTDPDFDLEEELKYRTEDKPYIITHDEYFEGELDYEMSSLTYYEVDDTLTNEKDEPIREIDETIGEDHLVRFGHGSRDRNIVYIRNHRLEMDFEVVKSTGSYLEEVLGMVEDDDSGSLKHSDQREQRRAFRRGDE